MRHAQLGQWCCGTAFRPPGPCCRLCSVHQHHVVLVARLSRRCCRCDRCLRCCCCCVDPCLVISVLGKESTNTGPPALSGRYSHFQSVLGPHVVFRILNGRGGVGSRNHRRCFPNVVVRERRRQAARLWFGRLHFAPLGLLLVRKHVCVEGGRQGF